MSAARPPTYDGKARPWRKLERAVFKLQRRIYRASSRGDRQAVQRRQRLLIRSRAAKRLAVRRVSQDHRGQRTAGVDGVNALTPARRLALAEDLARPEQAAPARRVWIPKPGPSEHRPLGIPTRGDRAAQALIKLALEPEWAARFEPNSYGFRPGRSAHDAIVAIVLGLCRTAKDVLDADIAKGFARSDQQAVLQKLQTITVWRRAIRAWLRVGVLDGRERFPTDAGPPQGGVRSPLLANSARHGLETAIRTAYPSSIRRDGEHQGWKPIVIRDADDLVILHPDHDVSLASQSQVTVWLTGVGLELHPTKRGRWDFGVPEGPTLVNHQATAHHRHVKVRGARSPFDGDWVYSSIRLGRYPDLPRRVARLLRRQRGRCARWGLCFRDGELPEIDHVIPRKLGGPDGYINWQLLHRHCHDQKTAADAVMVSLTTDQLTEEPEEGKLSRPVLEAGGERHRSPPSYLLTEGSPSHLVNQGVWELAERPGEAERRWLGRQRSPSWASPASRRSVAHSE